MVDEEAVRVAGMPWLLLLLYLNAYSPDIKCYCSFPNSLATSLY
ncbi:hypothetical protein M8C21_005070 [Ambrosia artemisiifolia]|uniref:Uncharacterized protein n=1 Tax=Ambrosia artemisiifolia TaxID=4212 RepID=A0AAD5CH89_AMBAR|nr:hypothetical protein M8C21_005069 [Ambrosia artemisiifolia]KAI7741872.1 hypothetical protein M8C21_005070 [Ambrosia artemisiifolia]